MIRKWIGYALLGFALGCLVAMLVLWFYMIWNPVHDHRLEDTQGFLLIVMMLTGFGGGLLITFA